MEDDRVKKSLPLVLVFLASIGIFSYETGNPWWLIIGLAASGVIFLIRRIRGSNE